MIDFVVLGELPASHPGALVLKARPRAQGGALPAALSAGRSLVGSVAPTGGLANLARLERTGQVTGVFPVDLRLAVRGGPATGAGALSILADQAEQPGAAAASIVRVGRGVDLDGLVDELAADPEVDFASRVPARYAAVAASPVPDAADSLTGMEQRVGRLEAARSAQTGRLWNLDRIGLPDVEASGAQDGYGVRVAVLDTGVDAQHPALRGHVVSYVHGGSGDRAMSGEDVVGHGTHVCGVIASGLNAALGTRGICQAGVSVWKIFDDEPDYVPRGAVYWYLVDPVLYRRALAECLERVDVLNLSIGGTQPPDAQEAALFRLLVDRGVTVVAAMGNERTLGSPVSYPAAVAGVVGVGATTTADLVASFSNSGDHIALSAPGVGIWSTMPRYPGRVGYRAGDDRGRPVPGTPFAREVDYASMDGTSMAAPHVTAAAALLLANSPGRRTPEDVRDLLMVTAARTPAMRGARWTPDIGAGRLDLRRLVFAASRL